MTLVSFLVLVKDCETIHVLRNDESVFFGKAKTAFDDICDNDLCKKIKSVFTGFGGLCVEIW